MARKRKTWKQAVESDKGYAAWTFGTGQVRSLEREKAVAKRVSEALKAEWNPGTRRIKARKFAERMWRKAAQVRADGCDSAYMRMKAQPNSAQALVGGGRSPFGRDVLNALSWGVGDGHNRVMIARYEAAAKAAERFLRRR